MKIISVVGARPNFMKIAPFIRAIENHNAGGGAMVEHILVHTGQHYDHQMSQAFFYALNIPPADIHLEVGSGSHAEQVGNTMIAFEKVLMEVKPDWVVVVGDVNATLACSVTAKKLHVKCCHIEAGLRSGDERMPEEINRLVTDRLSDLLLTPDTLSIEVFGLWDQVVSAPNLVLMQPIGYHDMLRLNMTAKLFLTDSGGLQEECTVLGTPCLTMRWNTERPLTLQEYGGASVLVGNNVERIREEYHKATAMKRNPVRPELWDGKTAER